VVNTSDFHQAQKMMTGPETRDMIRLLTTASKCSLAV